VKNIIQLTGEQIRAKRAAAGIPGYVLSRAVHISRGRLSEIETGVVQAASEDLQRIDAALDQIIREREKLSELAARAGLSLRGVRL
jgi:transcriptional regulator with XRE-family HTH domain